MPIKLQFSRIKPESKLKSGIPVTSFDHIVLAGSEKYRSITTGHYRFALGAVLLYDITNADSFKNLSYWLENIRMYADENIVIALVANKADILYVNEKKRAVKREHAEKFARDNNLIFIGESSALSN